MALAGLERGVSVHTLGFTSNHDPDLLNRLSLAGDTYARIDIVIVSPSEAKDISSLQLDVLRPSRWP